MQQKLVYMALLVHDYDEAIDFYTNQLNFVLQEDTQLSDTKRWVVISPPGGEQGAALLLAKASTPEQMAQVGNQSGGRVFLFLHTDDLERDRQNLRKHQISIVREPVEESFGKVLVFKDLYGNLWDLIEPIHSH